MFRPINLLLTALLLFTACSDEETFMTLPGNDPDRTATPDTTVSYLALGDSYTIGTSVSASERWPAQLADQLLSRERIKVEPLEIVARNGWRTDNLANALSAGKPGSDFDLVSLLIGVNDQYQGFSVETYVPQFERLLQWSIGYAGGDTLGVFVVSIPDYAYTPFGGGREEVSRDIDAFNEAASAICSRYGIPFYDITPISRDGLTDPDLVASDGLHPSGQQYNRWVSEVLLAKVAGQIRHRD
ncbi:lysophospholipase L1-like esterase [Lewinella aquimaris]|uniref:Lysophospholipase L1-like esterase n=1 Tax=Neolewinella aquimaris TaxID=1835722 RepID=A0A840DX13_9BACT|nr:SGNH/GDSL hydrolase family protein [Neolewinella aquimaris]MBB4077754.1 lysophospholipase L1-like esterase [Neolewinella aquimaris]